MTDLSSLTADQLAEKVHRLLAYGYEVPSRAEQAVTALAELQIRANQHERDRRKVEAYDAARAVVKREGLSRAEYVLRAEAAEKERDEDVRLRDFDYKRFTEAKEAVIASDKWRVAAEARLAETQNALEQGIEAFRLTREYVGEGLLPAVPGWSWFDWCEKARAALTTHPADE